MVITAPAAEERTTGAGVATALLFAAAVVFALLVRGTAALGVALLFLLFVPLEKLFALRPQKVFRRGLLTDLTHILVNNVFVTIATLVLVVVAALPLIWVRGFDVEAMMPTEVAIVLAVALVSVGNYWGHRLTHAVPFLWRFHSVHHSIEQMDWVASGRLHPLDSGFTQAFTVLPLFLLGYDAGVFAGVTVFITLLALFQHANVRLRFPGVRWVINTPEWHHWHHAIDDDSARQELRPPHRRPDLRHRVPPAGPAPDRLRHPRSRAAGQLPPSPRLSVHRGGAATRWTRARRGVGGVRFGMISGWPKSAVGTSGGRIRSSSSPTSPSSRSTWVT